MRRKYTTSSEKARLVQFLLQNSSHGRVHKGKINEAMELGQVSRSTVQRVWVAARKQQEKCEVIHLKSGKITCLRQKMVHLDLSLISSLPPSKRSTIRRLTVSIDCKKSTVGKWIQKGLIKAHTNALKPDLTAPNKLLRLTFTLEALQFDRIMTILKFSSMFNTIHIDEKWFYITKGSHRYYMAPGEDEIHRTCKIKSFITKVMFMCAVSRPLLSEDGSVIFDGKIRIFPFTETGPCLRGSKHRPKGTIITKPMKSITKQEMKDCVLKQILPAIKAKWPANCNKTIEIQQDNAKPHIKDSDPDFRAVASSEGFNIILVQQPPNSPDTNVNDLGWFRAIQSIQVESVSYNVKELVNAVISSFDKLSPLSLNNMFLILQSCMIEIMKVRGQNCYKIPHMKKESLARQGMLHVDLEVSMDLVRDCIQHLEDEGVYEGIGRLKEMLGFMP